MCLEPIMMNDLDIRMYDPFEPVSYDHDMYDEWEVMSYPMADYG